MYGKQVHLLFSGKTKYFNARKRKGKNTKVTESRRGFWMPRTIRFEARSQWNNLDLDFDLESKGPVLSQPI